jgi:hypothetical protein
MPGQKAALQGAAKDFNHQFWFERATQRGQFESLDLMNKRVAFSFRGKTQ